MILQRLFSFDRTDLASLLIACFLGMWTMSTFWIGNPFFVLIAVFLCVVPLLWKFPQAGFLATLLLTMVFGEKFSILPLSIDQNIYRLYALDILLGLTFLCWFLQQNTQRSVFVDKLIPSKKNFWLFAFWIVFVFNAIRSLLFSGADPGLTIGSLKNYSYLLVYFLLLLLFRSTSDAWKIAKTLFWGGIALSVFIIYGFVAGKGLWSDLTPGLRYLSGLHTYYITFSLIPLGILLAQKSFVQKKPSLVFLLLLQISGLIGSMFRHLWLGVMASSAIVFFLLQTKERRNALKNLASILIVMTSLVIVVFWWSSMTGNNTGLADTTFTERLTERVFTLTQTGDEAEEAAGWRVAVWNATLKTFLEHPFFGVGLGQRIPFEFRGFTDHVDLRSIHNDIVSILTQLGLIGVIPLVIFSLYQFFDLKNLLQTNNPEQRFLALCLTGFWIVALFGTFFALYLVISATSIFYWTVMGMISLLATHQYKPSQA